jgi:oxygen-independent coproporphyrinogen-3 oxidase
MRRLGMKLQLQGHEYQYAVEQMLATLFPGEKPDYSPASEGEAFIRISFREAEKFATAVCLYRCKAGAFSGRAAVCREKLTDPIERDRLFQYIIKRAMYRAVRASGLPQPPWGALTGVRPGKLMRTAIRRSDTKDQAISSYVKEYDVTRARAEICYETTLETEKAERFLTKESVCLYIGIPFCPTRCAYCSFVSQATKKSLQLIDPFLEALIREVQAIGRETRKLGLKTVSVYCGGGTPTTLSAYQLDRLFSCLEKETDLSCLREFTVEAGRPDTITEEKLKVLREHGVDRISVNPQSMQDHVLEAIGRKHTAKDILHALEAVRKTGGFAVNMDVIAGLPADTTSGFLDTMKQVLEIFPENITVHTLSLKKGASLRWGDQIPDAEAVGEMLGKAYHLLVQHGYAPYYLYRQKNMSGGFENTGWTKEGYTNLYNICMMEELCTILSAGGGVSTKLIHPEVGKNIRLTNPKYPLEYIQQIDSICEEKRKIGEFYEV